MEEVVHKSEKSRAVIPVFFLFFQGSELVEGVLLLDTDEISSTKIESLYVDSKTFGKMNRLRLLKLENVELSGDLGYLSGELRFLDWDSYQKESLPAGFQTDKLVDLRLRHSLIVKLSYDEKVSQELSVSLSSCRRSLTTRFLLLYLT